MKGSSKADIVRRILLIPGTSSLDHLRENFAASTIAS